jgi:hypothetical protein
MLAHYKALVQWLKAIMAFLALSKMGPDREQDVGLRSACQRLHYNP